MSVVTSLPAPQLERGRASQVYFNLADGRFSDGDLASAARFLETQLAQTAQIDEPLPDLDGLHAWMQDGVETVGEQYREYLDARHAGQPRRFFRSRAHALHFLKSVAPTKLVDGSWLYGLLPRWQDPRFLALIQTYLEELGEGSPAQNHVVLYRKLLATQGCGAWDDLTDDHYVQGAIQLTLAYHAEQFLPEIIGYNLGYEQLPLHLLVTAYELRELGIDPYYFSLHVTVDNADSGHARKAVDAIADALPKAADPADFYRRVQRGYKLNFLGADTLSVIGSFDLDREMISLVARKGVVGRHAHSDYREVAGRTVNDWLTRPEEARAFLAALEQQGWFQRHQDPRNSRFWKLIQSEKAPMFGVFSPYEQEIIYEWIAGDAPLAPRERKIALADAAKHRLRQAAPPVEQAHSDFAAEVDALRGSLAALDQDDAMDKLIALMSPANHHTSAGLEATRLFVEILK